MINYDDLPENYRKEHPVATDTGREHGPTRKDFEDEKRRKAQAEEKIKKGADTVRDRQEREKNRETNPDRERREIEHQEEKKAMREDIKDQLRKKRKAEKLKKKPRQGMELPGRGIGRLAGTSGRINQRPLLNRGVDFSGGAGLSMGYGRIFARPSSSISAGYSDPFRGMSFGTGLSGSGSPVKSASYRDPFSGMLGNPIKRGGDLSFNGSLSGNIFSNPMGKKKKGSFMRLF
jgi:hypothetical protein